MRTQTIKAKRLASDALRCLLVFLLAFSLTFYAQGAAFAEGESDGGSSTEQPSNPDPAPEPDPTPQPPTQSVEGISLFYETPYVGSGWKVASNSWENTPETHGQLTKKGESLQFKVQLVWNDGSTSWAGDTGHATNWSVSDTSVAHVSTSGQVTALANGTVTLTATCDGLSTSYIIDVSGQNNELYVENIVICNENGEPYTEAGARLYNTNQTLQLVARATVANPADGTTTDYLTSNGLLSQQTNGAIADLSWSVDDSTFGYVEPTTGLYRPAEEANVWVSASSTAGIGGATVTGKVCVSTAAEEKPDPVARPQDSLTVKVTWEEAPDKVVSEKTFSRAEVEAMGMVEQTYTVIGSANRFATVSGRGVLLSTVLEAAGANLDGIKEFRFVTADTPVGSSDFGTAVSYNMLFGSIRYYFPQYDAGGNVQEGIPVSPMLAVQSNFRWYKYGDSIDPDYSDMNDNACFRLLFGATGSGQVTSNAQVYWINTIKVVLAGAPPVQPEIGANTGDGTGQGGSGGGEGGGDGGSTGTDVGDATGLGGGSAAISDGGGGTTGGSWQVYQVMNPNPSDVDTIDFENPFAPFVIPFAVGTAAAGGVQMGVRYRRQKLPLR